MCGTSASLIRAGASRSRPAQRFSHVSRIVFHPVNSSRPIACRPAANQVRDLLRCLLLLRRQRPCRHEEMNPIVVNLEETFDRLNVDVELCGDHAQRVS
jgi:hypothetical protein